MSDNYCMDKDAYIKELEEENARLKKRIEELERLLGVNSRNSSKPPRLIGTENTSLIIANALRLLVLSIPVKTATNANMPGPKCLRLISSGKG